MRSLALRLRAALPAARDLIAWTAALPLPVDSQSFTSVALRHAREYPMNEGRIVSSDGLDIAIDEYDDHFTEHQVAHSTALHCLLHEQPYLVGPLARLNLNGALLPQAVRAALDATGIGFPSANPFHGIVARAAEIHYALLEAVAILEDYHLPPAAFVEVAPRGGIGFGCTEAPRGLLWHRFETDDAGAIRGARIVPPTSQNQARIEEDLRLSLQAFGLGRSDDELRRHGEMVIRNYDPCISCATHFLKLGVRRL